MNRALCTLVALGALMTSGCEVKLFTNKVDLECLPENPITTTPSSSEKDKFIDPDILPDKPLRKPTSATTSLPRNHIRIYKTQAPFVIPVGHSADSSCPLRNRDPDPIKQLNGSLCWAASAETVMSFHTQSPYPNQCDIANELIRQDRRSTADCCADKDHSDCQRTGLPSWAFKHYGFEWDQVRGPLKREKLAGQICDNGPLIFIFRYSEGGGHSFVVKDYVYDEETDELSLLVNDHSQSGTYDLWSYEDYSSGQWYGKHEHDVNYVRIIPPER